MKGDVPQLFFQVESPVKNTKKAWLKHDEDWIEIPVVEKNGVAFLELNLSQAQIRIEGQGGAEEITSYQLQPHARPLLLSSSCRKAKVKFKFASKQDSRFPAMLMCESKGKLLDKIYFSSTADSEWYGSDAFETGGKGEAWKSFSYKDVMTLPRWQLSWGSEEDKNTVQIRVPKPPGVEKPTIKSDFSISLGLDYLNGKVSKNNLSENVGAFIVPLRVTYQKNKSWWLVGGGYDLFIYSLQKNSAGSNSISKFEVWGGADYVLPSFTLRGQLGYLNRSIEAPTAGVSAAFSAPRLGFEVLREEGKMNLYGLSAYHATASSDGSYAETHAALFYQRQFLWNRFERLQIHYTQLKSKSSSLSSDASWLGIGLNLQF